VFNLSNSYAILLLNPKVLPRRSQASREVRWRLFLYFTQLPGFRRWTFLSDRVIRRRSWFVDKSMNFANNIWPVWIRKILILSHFIVQNYSKFNFFLYLPQNDFFWVGYSIYLIPLILLLLVSFVLISIDITYISLVSQPPTNTFLFLVHK
jgi:hypothetical protein